MPTVPWPAITSGSSNGCTKVRPRATSISRALACASSNASPCRTTSPPRRRTASTLIAGVVRGITIVAGIPSLRADSATPCAWLPADAQITPNRAARPAT